MNIAGYDAVVVGSGPAGCTAAILLGRAGLRVALLEAHRDPGSYKRMCTHSIQSSALPTFQRLGVDSAIEAAGARRTRASVWSTYGWVHEPAPQGRPAYGYNVRRQTLDPLLRSVATGTSGVDVLLGAKVRGLIRDGSGRVQGVRVTVRGTERELSSRIVVGADGKSSKVADRAELPGRELANGRFGFFAHYRNVALPPGESNQMWLLQPDAVYAFANDDGITVLAAMPAKARLPEFDQDREAALLRMFDGLPDAPDLSRAERVSDVIGTRDYPSITRRRITTPGVALVGDAALTGDPLWGVGCGWAVQSGEWLADAVVPALLGGDAATIDAAAARYARRHKRRLQPHQFLAVDFSSGRNFNLIERLWFSGAAHDPRLAEVFTAFGTRNASPAVLFSPRMLLRAGRAGRASRVAARSAPRPVAASV